MEDQLHHIDVVAIAMVLGGVVGLEREFADKPAGLRTQMFVCAAADAARRCRVERFSS